MLFLFFLRTNKTFRLADRPNPLKSFPQLCSSGSKIYPHIITQVSQIIPQTVSLTDDSRNVPLFIACKINANKTLSILDLETNKNTSFYLVFYPDTENLPLKVDSQINHIAEEYWKSVQPMFICRDMSGFYLGSTNDSGIVLFEQCNLDQAECFIYKIISGYNECTMLTENPVFNNISINLRKVNK